MKKTVTKDEATPERLWLGKYVCTKVSKNVDRVRGRDRECEEVWTIFINGKENRSQGMTRR